MTHALRSPKQLMYDKCDSPPGGVELKLVMQR